jgi:hypothetical protein
MAEAEQQINIGGPRADAVQRGQRGVRQVGLHIADLGEIDLSFGDGLADLADRLDLGRREAEPLELAGARAAHRVVMKRIEGGKQPGADRTGARGRELLSAYDGAQAGKARLAPAQAEFAGLVRNRLEPRIGADQLRQAGLQIGVGMKEMGHALSV